MTEAEQRIEADVIRAHHAAACGHAMPLQEDIREFDRWGWRFACPACGTTVTVLFPHRPTRGNRTAYGLDVTWGTIGPPTPENATNRGIS